MQDTGNSAIVMQWHCLPITAAIDVQIATVLGEFTRLFNKQQLMAVHDNRKTVCFMFIIASILPAIVYKLLSIYGSSRKHYENHCFHLI